MAEKPSKRYNVPSAVTEEVRRRERAKREREDAERSTDSNVSAEDMAGLDEKIMSRKDTEEMRRKAMDNYESDMESDTFEAAIKDQSKYRPLKDGGSVRKFAEGGLVRGSVRGGGVALRGVGKGKVY